MPKRGGIPGAKIGRRWVFIEGDLAEFIRSLYPRKRQALPVRDAELKSADRYSVGSVSVKEYEEMLKQNPTRRRNSASR